MSITFFADDKALRAALIQYAALKNKSDAEVVNKAMRFWLPFAASRVIKKTLGRPKIMADLMAPARNQGRNQRGSANLGRYRNTVAAAIVFYRMKMKGQKIKKRGNLTKVDKFFRARKRSANFLRAGFIPAFRKFDVPQKGPSNQKFFKGYSFGVVAKPSPRNYVEAIAANMREGAHEIAPDAFSSSRTDVTRIFLEYIAKDMARIARRTKLAP